MSELNIKMIQQSTTKLKKVLDNPTTEIPGLSEKMSKHSIKAFEILCHPLDNQWNLSIQVDALTIDGYLIDTYPSTDPLDFESLMNEPIHLKAIYSCEAGQCRLKNIMVYHQHITHLNRDAWNEAYLKSPLSYKEIANRLNEDPKQFLAPRLTKHLDLKNLDKHKIAQLACNNGREILAILSYYHAEEAMGFDISDAMIKDANQTAKSLDLNASFIHTDVYDIDSMYHGYFDDIFMLIGAITWFDDLNKVFQVVSNLLKPGGHFYLLDGHPITGMFAFEGEEGYNSNDPHKLVYSYFRKEPFIETDGMFYMNGQNYKSKPFVSFSHTFEQIIQGLIQAGLMIDIFEEGNENLLENFPELDGKHVPLIFYIDAIKR